MFRATWLSSAQNNRRESNGLPNARGSDFGWAQIQTGIHPRHSS